MHPIKSLPADNKHFKMLTVNVYSNDKNILPFEMNWSLVSQYMGFNIEWEHFYNMKENSRIYPYSATHSQMELLYFNHKCGISTSSVRSFHTIVNLGHVLKRQRFHRGDEGRAEEADLSDPSTSHASKKRQTSLFSFLS